jgi:serine-type D-Ala-D-Ala carboxypeptidase (penicillin-binding protein 5/6)
MPQFVVAQALQTNLQHAILIDARTRTVLFERGAGDLLPPASTAKLMTADIVFGLLASGKLKPDQLFTVSETAWRQGGAPSRGSTMFARVRSQISVLDLLRGLVVDSANDAAIVLAEGISGSQGAFATRMTEHARELGLDQLTFTDAWGGDNAEQRVSARDMALLADDLIQTYPAWYKLFAERDFAWNNIRQPNRNPLLGMDIGADGLKTGYIEGSGYSIVGSAVQNNQRLIVAVYGAKSASERSEETRKLLQWGFRAFETRRVFAAGDTVGSAEVYGGTSRDVPLVTRQDIDVLVTRDGSQKLTARVAYIGPLMAPVQADQKLAELKLFRGDKEVLSVPLRTAGAVPVGSLPKRALDAGLEYVGGLFRKYVLRS